MDEAKKLATFQSLQVEIKRSADEELLEHLYSTVLGMPGAMQYMHTSIEPKLENIKEIYFMLLRKSGRLLGSVGFAKRKTYWDNEEYKSWYIRYFSIKPALRSAKYDPEKAKKDASRSMGLLKGVALPYFENPDILEGEIVTPLKSFIYAYIDRANFRSLSFSEQMGMKPCRKFTTINFSRLKLKKHKHVSALVANERKFVSEQIKYFYSGYTMFTSDNIFLDRNYYVYRHEGEIVAGLQVHPDAWKVVAMNSKSSWLMLKFLPSIPGVKKIFNPDNFQFLSIEGIWFKPGFEKYVENLLESVCAEFKTHIALFWLDTESDLLKKIDANVKLGFMEKMIKRVEADIRLRFFNMESKEVAEFSERPAYISGLDMT